MPLAYPSVAASSIDSATQFLHALGRQRAAKRILKSRQVDVEHAQVIVANWLRCRYKTSVQKRRKRIARDAYAQWRQQLLDRSAGKRPTLAISDSVSL